MGQLEDILKHQNMVRNNIMKSFAAETSGDSLEKSFEDEVNPFEMEAYKSELTKAELDEFEKAKHQDGDMHPNGKWVWRQSAIGGKGDWRVAKTGGSKATAGGASAATSSNTYITPDNADGYVQKLNKVLDRKGYFAHATKNGSIEIYKKGDRKALKNLKASIIATDYINWGPNKELKDKLEHVIKEALSSSASDANKKDGVKSEKSLYESKEADAYDKGDGKVGNYPVPTHTSYPAANLYSRLKNNRHFGFKYGLPDDEIMKKLKDYKGNVKVSYHNNAGTSEIYRIKFL